ncbi:unnamed protein product (mitochondrion) [Plasmodiophora brassicae]|uniref:Fido domain-containing protein n=1 Tax=Plasmodiophora brassicae TaxID=37360 RepID=A0A3P3YFL5_PLABS|nr:unnamed protein product [Plasmodiophora brassicae]
MRRNSTGASAGSRSGASASRSISPVAAHRIASFGNDVDANCAFCNRQRQRGVVAPRCDHHFYPGSPGQVSMVPSATAFALSERSLRTARTLSSSASTTNLADEAIRSMQLDRLFAAAAKGDLETIEWLMLTGTDVWQRDNEQRTILHLAAAYGRLRVVEFLIEQNGDINAQDLWGYTPLFCAINNGHFNVAEYLVAHGAQHVSMVSRTDLAVKLCSLAEQGRLGDLEALACRGADLTLGDYDLRTPLHAAAASGNMLVCKFLVERACVPVDVVDRFGITPLQAAIANDCQDVVRYLEEKGAMLGDVQRKAVLYQLIAACGSGDLPAVRHLVDNDHVDVNGTDYDGRTPLHLAAASGNKELVLFLLERGAKPDAVDRWGADPHHEAARRNLLEIVETLDPENKSTLREPTPLDDPKGNLMELDGDAPCCIRFGQRRNLVHVALKLALRHIATARKWAYGEVWFANPSRLALQCCAVASYSRDDVQTSSIYRFRLSSLSLLIEGSVFFSGVPIRTGKPVWIENLSEISQTAFFCAPMARAAGLLSALALPVRVSDNDQAIAYVVFLDDQPRPRNEKLQDGEVSRTGFLSTISRVLGHDSDVIGSPTNTSSSVVANLPFIVQLLVELNVWEQFSSWGLSMTSEDHKAAMPFLLWVVDHIVACDALRPKLLHIFHFLYTVSPLLDSESPIRSQAEHALKKLQDTFNVPYFGPGKPRSPVFSHIAALKANLYSLYAQSPHREQLESGCPPVPDRARLSLSSGEVFDAAGSHRPVSPWNSSRTRGFFGFAGPPAPEPANESDALAELGSEMLRTMEPSELVTCDTLRKMHRCLQLEEDTTRGEFRQTLAVGSHMFYKFYRVFAPAEEVPELIRMFENELRGESKSMPPVLHAFYVFNVIVCFIHPFEDGNGRIGRVLGNMILKSYGCPPVFRSNHKVLTFEEVMELVLSERMS